MRTTTITALLAAILCGLTIGTRADDKLADKLTPAEARAIAKEAYIYGFPIVDNYRIQHAYWVDRANPEYKGPLAPEQQAQVVAGLKEGEAKIKQYLKSKQKNINGWKVGSLFGDSAFYNGDWLERAAAAQADIYGNDAAEAMYPMTKTLANGEPLDGSKHNYTLTFAAGQFPPVNAFWSVTMYDGKSQLLIENPINRYLINSPMLPQMKMNADDSLTLYIQKNSPGADKQSNWLPAPEGPIYLVTRLYWPKTEAPSVLPPGEGTWKPPALVKAQ